ncbi:protein scarlet-like [Diaphorina citri]|uniref:Protein scarlet-like n=1 Tax=Diaphorina citri TaxID=121845 RepID=A0A3Q0IW07_DIACI|nr:protein scarlet-like [Diaphorina citri]
MFSLAFSSVSTAMACLVPFDYTLMITAGVFYKLSSLPPYFVWIRYLSWLEYSNEALTITQWQGVTNISKSSFP